MPAFSASARTRSTAAAPPGTSSLMVSKYTSFNWKTPMYISPPASARALSCTRFAIAVTERPHALGADDIAPLHAVGMGDEEIIDLLHAVAIFGWANRLMQNLGEPVGPASSE